MFLRFARFLPRLRRVRSDGRETPRRWRRWLGRTVLTLALLGALAMAGLWLAVLLVPFNPDEIAPAETSSILVDRKGRTLRAYLSRDERWRLPARLDTVSPWVVKATVAVEDKRFFRHSGIDFIAVARATLSNLRRGRTVSGASTISMQSAGLGDEPRRTWWLKLRQTFRTLQLERAWSKQQILEFYLTHAPYGGNVCGIEAAAQRYFNKPARELSLSEATLVAGLPQSPSRLRPDRNMAAALKRRAHVLRRMLDNGDITRADYERVLPQRPPVGQFDAPVEAPHFCDYVHARHPFVPLLKTTVDLDVQRMAEERLRAKVRALAPRGVTNGAAVVLENATGNVLAMVGSVDYEAVADAGQVNGATSPRSPGSTLKPFLYGLAFERRLMLPSTVLADVPQPFSEYRPENFDRTFLGLVTAEKALAWSLNIPAIDVLRQTGVPDALRLLRSAGLESLHGSAGEYGLSLAIGTCQTRLVDLANAYAMLARGGRYRSWRAWENSQTSGTALALDNEVRLLSRGASYFINRALSDPGLRPPEGIDPALAGMEGVAWKTGTSSGFRDAWTFAWDSRYTVGVWMGNMDGRPSRALTGSEAAAPVALGMMSSLRGGRGEKESDWLREPADIATEVVCQASGLLCGTDCPTTATVKALRQESGVPAVVEKCQIHKRLLVDDATSSVLCTRCLSGRSRSERTYALWPTATAAWLATQGHSASDDVPPHFAGCRTLSPFAPPRVVSPRPGDRYLVTAGRPAAFQKLALEANAAPAGSRLYWFLDGNLVQVSQAGSGPAFTELTPGRHTVRCVDQYGRADTVSFLVEEE